MAHGRLKQIAKELLGYMTDVVTPLIAVGTLALGAYMYQDDKFRSMLKRRLFTGALYAGGLYVGVKTLSRPNETSTIATF